MENRLINYWKNGKWFTGANPNKSITSIAKPKEAQTAIKKASAAGAFTLPSKKEVPQSNYDKWKASGATHAGGYSGYLQAESDKRAKNEKIIADRRAENARMDDLNKDNPLYSGNSNVTTSSVEDRAKAQLAQDQSDLYDIGQEYSPDDNPIQKSSLDDKVSDSIAQRRYDKLVEDQKKEAEYLKKQQARQDALDTAAFGRMKEQSKSAIGATATALSQGRSDPMAATNPMLAQEYTGEMERRIGEANTRLTMAQDQRERVKERLAEAQRQGRESAIESISLQLAAAENAVRKADTDYLAEVNEATKNALDIQYKQAQTNSKAFDIFEKMPMGGLADMPIEDISAMMGIDTVMATYMQSADKQRSTLDPSDPSYAINMAKITKATNEARWAGMPTSAKEFTHYENLLKINPERAEMYAKSVGIIDSPTKLDAARTAEINAKTAEKYGIENNGIYLPINSKYSYSADGDSVTWNIEAGTYNAGRDGWCAGFANDCLVGTSGFYGDSFKSKMEKNNSSLPIAGGGFIEYTNDDIGHVGVIEKVYPDGSFDIRDSNYSVEGTVDTDHIVPGTERYKNIVEKGGFTDMNKYMNPKLAKTDYQAEALKLGLSKSDQETYTELRQKGFNKGDLTGAYDIADAVIAGTTELKGLTPTMSANVIPILNAKGYRQTVAKETKQEVDSIINALDDIVSKYNAVPSGARGPIDGWITTAVGAKKWNTKIVALDQASAIVGMQLTRLFEKGRISDQDRIFYLERMPNIQMTPPVAKTAAEELKKLLANKIRDYETDVNSLLGGEAQTEGKTDLEIYNSYSPNLNWDDITQ